MYILHCSSETMSVRRTETKDLSHNSNPLFQFLSHSLPVPVKMVQFPCQVWLVTMRIKQPHDFTGVLGWVATQILLKKKGAFLVDPTFLQRGLFFFWTTRSHKSHERGYSQVRCAPGLVFFTVS